MNTLQSTKYTVFFGGTLGTFFLSVIQYMNLEGFVFLQERKCEGPGQDSGLSEPRCAANIHSPPSRDNGNDFGKEQEVGWGFVCR